MRDTLREALTTEEPGPKIIVASSECMLNKQRRVKPLMDKAEKAGEPVLRQRFGVDEDICTGDHACIRLSGCPSLSVKQLDDPLRDDPVAAIDNSCVACGNCGDVADAAVLCPSFYRADVCAMPIGLGALQGAHPRRRDRLPAAAAGEAPHPVRPAGSLMFDGTQATGEADLHRHPRHGRAGRRRADGLDRRGGGGQWLACPVDLRAGRRPAHRRDALLHRDAAAAGGQAPVLALMPTPGDVDVVIAAELMEAGRSILRGLATPERTSLITSTHRAYAVAEKEKPGESIADPQAVNAAAGIAARRVIAFDMERAARESGTVISAPLLGALAGCRRLALPARELRAGDRCGRQRAPPPRSRASRTASRGRASNELPQVLVEAEPRSSRAAGQPGLRRARRAARKAPRTSAPPRMPRRLQASSAPSTSRTSPMAMSISRGSKHLAALDARHGGAARGHAFTAAAAKHLANAMAYDDVIGVADLKTRSARFARIAGGDEGG